MIYIPRWKIVLVLVVTALSFIYSVPNFLGEAQRHKLQASLPSWMPTKAISLGLDLRGGSHLLLQVDVNDVVRQRADDMLQQSRKDLRAAKISYQKIATLPDGITATFTSDEDRAAGRQLLAKNNPDLIFTEQGDVVEGRYSEQSLKQLKSQVVSQSIEIVGRRVNETGTNEPFIARQGEDRILIQLPGVDNPERIKQLLGKTAKLTFHLVDMDSGADSRMLPLRETPGEKISIKRRPILTGDMLVDARASFQDTGPVVSFRLNADGTRRFCEVTTQNVNAPFAIVLDDQVISAPRINEAICGGQAVISGNFTVQEVNDVSLLLRAGALPTALTVVEERSVGPSLGSDSIRSGGLASLIGFVLVVGYMVLTYNLFGVFASMAMIVNMAITIALMSMLQATLTLPGIAGLVLAMGMAVDANVLIFERMKEEVRNGKSIVASIDSGFDRAMASITDSNLTTLIAGIILYAIGTGPIKGFAVTLSIGIIASMFTAVLLTKVLLVFWFNKTKPKKLPVS